MESSLGDVWRRLMLCFVTVVVMIQVLTDVRVAKGEFVHKNFSESVGDSGPSLGLREDDTIHQTEGSEVRCHCNLPRCITLGYMCKSVLGACFTNNTPAPTHAYNNNHKPHHRWAPMHGCVELLPEARHAECIRKGGVRPSQGVFDLTPSPSTPPPQPDAALTCCRHDMCNYRDIDMFIQTEVDGHADMKRQDSEMETLWFRAATIAIPIAGGFILIVLVLLATKMLAKENKRQRMAQVLGEHYLKAALYPGGGGALTHSSICCHSPLTKTSPMSDIINIQNPCEEKTPNYRHPGGHIYNIEEIKPLNVMHQDDQWDQRLAESPPHSSTLG